MCAGIDMERRFDHTAAKGGFPEASLLTLSSMGSFDFVGSFASERSNSAQDDRGGVSRNAALKASLFHGAPDLPRKAS